MSLTLLWVGQSFCQDGCVLDKWLSHGTSLWTWTHMFSFVKMLDVVNLPDSCPLLLFSIHLFEPNNKKTVGLLVNINNIKLSKGENPLIYEKRKYKSYIYVYLQILRLFIILLLTRIFPSDRPDFLAGLNKPTETMKSLCNNEALFCRMITLDWPKLEVKTYYYP